MTQHKRIILTEQQLRSIPGHSTKKTVDQLRGMVAGLIVESGLKYFLGGEGNGDELVLIEMVLDSEDHSVKRVVHFKIEVPQIYQKMQKGAPKPLPEVGWRFCYDYMERRLVSVRLGITDLVEEFTANIVTQLPDGKQGTLGDQIKQSMKNPDHPMLPFIMQREAEA